MTATFQLWTWHEDGERYDLDHLLIDGGDDGGQVHARPSSYWALTRAEVARFADATGFTEVRRLLPEQSTFVQPLLVARRPA